MPISDHTNPKYIEMTLQCELAPAGKISVHSIYSFLKYSHFQSPVTRLAMPISDHAQPKKNFINFYFM